MRSKTNTPLTIFFVLLATLALLSGCRKEADQPSSITDIVPPTMALEPPTSTIPSDHPGSPGGARGVPAVVSGTSVLVLLQDNRIEVATDAIPPGPAVLDVANRGTMDHNLVVEGKEISRGLEGSLAEGQSQTLDILFRPGEYTLYCPVLNHRNLGEETKITIAEP